MRLVGEDQRSSDVQINIKVKMDSSGRWNDEVRDSSVIGQSSVGAAGITK